MGEGDNLPPIYTTLGELVGEMRGIHREVQELKKLALDRHDWEKSVEKRMASHEERIRNIEKRSLNVKIRDTSPTLKITITGSVVLSALAMLIGVMIHGGVP